MGATNLDALAVSGAISAATLAATSLAVTSTDADTADVGTSLTLGVTAGIVAAGSNSQANSTLLTTPINIVATVSATTRGVRLPPASAGLFYIVKNKSATLMNVYPATGDAINVGSTNAAYDLAAVKTAIFVAEDATTWHTILTA